MENKLQEQMCAVANEVARQFGKIFGQEPEFWVDDDPTGICSFGDVYYFSLTEMKRVVDNLPRYIKRYGSVDAVGDEIRSWVEWWLDVPADMISAYIASRVTHHMHPNISLSDWLSGCPRADRNPWEGNSHDYFVLQNERDALDNVMKRFGGDVTLSDARDSICSEAQQAQRKYRRDLEKEMKEISKACGIEMKN